MSSLIDGLIAGYGIAIPVGAISVLIVSLAMEKGFRSGVLAAAGVATVDLTCAAIAVFAGSVVVTILLPYETPLRILSGLVLIALGVYGIIKLRRRDRGRKATELSEGRIYLQFIALTALNPFTIVYFLALITGNGADWDYTLADCLWFIFGVGMASLSWQILLAYIGATARDHFSDRFLVATIIVGNIVVMALGVQIIFF
jgi:threonine/homoserine/homoserine lactone efflux protein